MDICLIFFNMRVCCGFSLESPHQGNSNEYTQHTIININKNSAEGYVSPGKEHVSMTYICNSYS